MDSMRKRYVLQVKKGFIKGQTNGILVVFSLPVLNTFNLRYDRNVIFRPNRTYEQVTINLSGQPL